MIVSCLFPLEEDISRPCPPPARPVLIVGVHSSLDAKVLVAFGSGAKASGTTGEEDLEEFQIEVTPLPGTGLTGNTRFDFLKAIPLDWTDRWFVPSNGRPGIKMGHLPNSCKDAANAAKNAAAELLKAHPERKWGKTPTPKKPLEVIRRKAPPNRAPSSPLEGAPPESINPPTD